MLARYLRPVADHPAAMDEATAVGGIMMMAIGLGLTQIKAIPAELFLPAIFLAPGAVLLIERFWPAKKENDPEEPETT